MASEVFRFATVRQSPAEVGTTSSSSLTFQIQEESRLIGQLRQNREPNLRAKLIKIVRGYVASPEYAGMGAHIDRRLIAFTEEVSRLNPDSFAETARSALEEAFEANSAELRSDQKFAQAHSRIGDSIVATSIDYAVPSAHRVRLTRLAGAWALAEALASGRTPSKTAFEQPNLVLPRGIFPLPRQIADEKNSESRAARLAAQRAERERVVKSVESLRAAVDEIMATLRRGETTELAPTVRRGRSGAGRPLGFVLNARPGGVLTNETRAALRGVGLTGRFDAARAIELIENKMTRATESLHRAVRDPQMIRIGNTIVPRDRVLPSVDELIDIFARHPGPCPAPAIEPTGSEAGPVTVPSGHGEAKVVGIADLMIVEQELARYELGEIAHIENVLKGETRVRSNRVATTIEESVTVETEELEEAQKDLSTAERFELQSETQQVLTQNANMQAGLTITASYGPTVDATATASAGVTTSRQTTTRIASSFARETTARAVSRVQKRKFERRTTKTVREFEERNLHRFDGSSADISGVYRFVDKIYTAQVVNYGKRLLLEFIVPEPAAFWRHALARQPVAPVPFTCPEPPGYCVEADGSFAPLQAQDIDPENYQFWASQYGAEDIPPPPPKTRVVSSAKKGPEQTSPADPKMSSDAAEIDIPDGYNPIKATVNAYGETQMGIHKLMIQIQDQQFQYTEPWDDQLEIELHQEATSKLPISINSLRFHNYEVLFTIFCVLRQEKMEEWQLKAYFAIMKAYEAAKSQYQAALEAAQMNAAYAVDFGRNPANNRTIEANELKRACITMMSGQHFESFDAMAREAGPYRYPEINLAEAKAEARYVQLFEHGLDWMNLTYVFYPYFWTRKDQWLTLAQLNDADPLFAQFLQAGSARVQVPVRVGFENSILNYLAGVEIWDADGNLINFDEGGGAPNLSILSELKSRLSNEFEQGPGTLSLTQGNDTATAQNTEFTDSDERRRIRIGMATYVIEAVEGQTLRLDRPFEGVTATATRYALGPRLIGEPWEVRVPTDLVKLADLAIN